MLEKLSICLDRFLERGIPGYDCVIYHKGEAVYRRTCGYSDREKAIPMRGDEVFNVYSCSKLVTCVAALLLWERGVISLDHPLSRYLPEFSEVLYMSETGAKRAEREITLKDLFCMSAGFSYNIYSPNLRLCREETDGKCPTREAMRYLSRDFLLFSPGERWEYSLCHDVLAAVIEVASGVRFGKFVEENIFKPLGMKNSTFSHTSEIMSRVAPQYSLTKGKVERITVENEYVIGSEYECGGGGCISTVDDFIIFLEALRKGEILRSETVDMMTENRFSASELRRYWIPNYGYGLGVRCSKGNDGITDFGWGGAAGAFLFIDRENELSGFYAQHVRRSGIEDEWLSLVPMVKSEFLWD
ncbi:MAG: beta-lactamase family protein [Ruminococcaceae bacterium]|nr:beta-lactamase family protein [Oscillospiraceae bacterium]